MSKQQRDAIDAALRAEPFGLSQSTAERWIAGASQVFRGLRHRRSASILSAGGTVAALRSRAGAEGAAAAWILMGRLHYGGEGRPLLRGEGQLRPTLVLRVADGDHGASSGHFDAVAVAEAGGGLAPANAG